MDTLPDHVKKLIYEYDNTYHDIFDGVMVEIVKFKRNRMRAKPLLCALCYRNKVALCHVCEYCFEGFEIKMEWLNDPTNWASMSDCENDLDYDSDF